MNTHRSSTAKEAPVVDTSLKKLSLISLQVDWTQDLSSAMANISPTGNGRQLSCLLDLKNCSYSKNDIILLLNAYKTHGYSIIATHVPTALEETLQQNGIHFIKTHTSEGLTLYPVPATQVQVTSTQINIPTTKDKSLPGSDTSNIQNKLQVGTVRSGQQVYAEDCSLTVMGTVNEGAEIMSDGDIYVFGKLRGRAVAGLGAKDATDCRIYVTQFEASLIGIKSVFLVPEEYHEEDQLLKGRDVCISLEAKNPTEEEVARSLHKHGHGQQAAPVICSIECDEDYTMVFRPVLQ